MTMAMMCWMLDYIKQIFVKQVDQRCVHLSWLTFDKLSLETSTKAFDNYLSTYRQTKEN